MTDIQAILIIAFVFGIPAVLTIFAISLSGRCSREEEDTAAQEGYVHHLMHSEDELSRRRQTRRARV